MGEVISATTRFARAGGKSTEFLSKARVLLAQSIRHREEGDLVLALELSYQSALRTAGAVFADSAAAARRRKPTGAWERLRLVDEKAAAWADELSGFSRIRARAVNGLDVNLTGAMVDAFMVRVEQFLSEAEDETGWLPAVA